MTLNQTNAVIVRARAFRTNYFPGPVHSETYTWLTPTLLGEPFATNAAGVPLRHVLNPNINQFRSDLPLLVINTYGKQISESGNLPVHFALFETHHGVATVTNLPELQTRGGMKIRGSSSASLSKKQYAIQWTDDFEQDQELSPLGMPAESEWVLYAPDDFEPVCIHNPFIFRLAEAIGEYAPRTRFVEVFINRAGPLATNQYAGLYVLEEKITIGNQRVPSPKLQPEDNTLPDVTGPYLMKIDRLDPGDSGLSAGGQPIALISPKEKELKQAARAPQKKYLTDYLNAMNRGLGPTLLHNPTNGYEAFIDVNKAIDYHIIETLSGNVDALVLSAYFYKPRNGKLIFGPHWDFDRALGSTDGRDANPRAWLAGPFFTGWLGAMFKDVEAWQRWVDRFQQLRTNQLANTYTGSLMDQLANQIRQAEKRDLQKWKISRRFGGYQGELEAMKRWVSNRLDFIDRQLAQPPVASRPSGLVRPEERITLSFGPNPTTNAVIWYTLDGSDPRAIGVSNHSPSAIQYSGPFQVSSTVRVIARTLDSLRRQTGGPASTTPWSGPTARTWLTNQPPLSLTEVHFHPLGDGGNSSRQADDFEFLEFKNTARAALDLTGFHLTGDVEFSFAATNPVIRLAPQARFLLVRNAKGFTARYGTPGIVAGEYIGKLNDSSGRLLLTDPAGQVVFDFTYDDRWVPPADGSGYSMVVRSEALQAFELDTPSAWVASAEVHGSPGRPDSASDVAPDTDLNGNGLPDAWERAYFGNTPVTGDFDSDGDGFSNREEFLAGTDHRQASSAPRLDVIPSPFGGNPVLRFPRVGGRAYRLLYQNQLDASGPWSELLRFPGDATAEVGEFRDLTTTNSTRFYRVATP